MASEGPQPRLALLSEVTSYDVFYERMSALCPYPRDWFALITCTVEEQAQQLAPQFLLQWLGPGNTPTRCNWCHIPQYETRVGVDQPTGRQYQHHCAFAPCSQYKYCLNSRASKCTTCLVLIFMTCYFNGYCFIKGPTHQAEVLQLCAQATAQAIAWRQQGEEQKTQAQMHKKQQWAEQVSHIKSLENDIGAANMCWGQLHCAGAEFPNKNTIYQHFIHWA